MAQAAGVVLVCCGLTVSFWGCSGASAHRRAEASAFTCGDHAARRTSAERSKFTPRVNPDGSTAVLALQVGRIVTVDAAMRLWCESGRLAASQLSGQPWRAVTPKVIARRADAH